jgi:dTDP-4-dehydrorhamnose reductase
MLRLSETRDALNIVGDQIGGPTPARDIALACLQIADQLIQDPSKSGTYHFSGAPDVSWADFAKAIFDQAGKSVAVTPFLQQTIPRPHNVRLTHVWIAQQQSGPLALSALIG